MRKIFAIIAVLIVNLASAQVPVISGIDQVIVSPQEKVFISGSGFGTDLTKIKVWFGAQEGKVLSVTENLIEVSVPFGGTSDNVTVINLTSKKSVTSSRKFFSAFGGDNFDATKMLQQYRNGDPAWLYDLCTCDFNRDGKSDIAVTKFSTSASTLKIFVNQSAVGTLNFAVPGTSIPLSFLTADITCGDVNNDGWPDLIATKGGEGGADRNSVFIVQNSSGSFSTVTQLNLDQATVFTEKVKLKDLNNDGLPEIIISNGKTPQLLVFQNTSNGAISFNTTPRIIPLTGFNATNGLEIQDLDGDRKPDLIFSAEKTSGGTGVNVMRNVSSVSSVDFDFPITVATLDIVVDLITGDFNNDDKLDIVTSTGFPLNKINVNINSSTGTTIQFKAATNYTAEGAWGLDAADMDGDGWLDVISANSQGTNIHVLENKSTSPTAFSMGLKDIKVDYKTRNVRAADFDGDGKPDIATTTVPVSGYTLDVILNKNCSKPEIISELTRFICPGQTIKLYTNPIPGTTFIWKQGGVQIKSSTDNFVDITGAGNVTVTASQFAGACLLESEPVSFANGSGSVPGNPTPTNNGPLCEGETLNLSSPTITGATYHWDGPNNFTSDVQNPSIPNVTSGMAGEYILTIKIGDCQSSEVPTNVSIHSFPSFNITSSTGDGFCDGQSSTLSFDPITGYTYKWMFQGNSIGTGSSVVITTGGSYVLEATYTALGCKKTYEPFVIQSTAAPQITLNPEKTTACMGELVQLDASVVYDQNYTLEYVWDFGDGTTSTDLAPQHTWSTAKSYTVSLKVNYVGFAGCNSTETFSMAVTAAVIPVVQASVLDLCAEDAVGSDLSVQAGYTLVEWYNNATQTLISSEKSITVNAPGEYFVKTVDANGCNSSSTPITIGEKPSPVLVVSPADTTIVPGAEVPIEVTGADSYEWSPVDNLSDPFGSSITATPPATIVYTVFGTLASSGCTSSATVNIKVDAGNGVPLNIIPARVFTPSQLDGINDTWEIQNITNYPGSTITIFDRRGRVLYEVADYQSDWDGTVNGTELPAGTYYYMIVASEDFYLPFKGTVLIVR